MDDTRETKFNERLEKLTDEEKAHRLQIIVPSFVQKKLTSAKTEEERERIIVQYADMIHVPNYIPWTWYLYGLTEEKPLLSTKKYAPQLA